MKAKFQSNGDCKWEVRRVLKEILYKRKSGIQLSRFIKRDVDLKASVTLLGCDPEEHIIPNFKAAIARGIDMDRNEEIEQEFHLSTEAMLILLLKILDARRDEVELRITTQIMVSWFLESLGPEECSGLCETTCEEMPWHDRGLCVEDVGADRFCGHARLSILPKAEEGFCPASAFVAKLSSMFYNADECPAICKWLGSVLLHTAAIIDVKTKAMTLSRKLIDEELPAAKKKENANLCRSGE